MANTLPANELPQTADPFTTGDDMLERAKQIGKEIEEKVRKLTGDTSTPPHDTPLDPTDEVPPLTSEAPPLP